MSYSLIRTMIIPILHFIDALGAGGTELQLVYLLEHLDRTRFKPSVLTTYDHFRHYEPTLKSLDVPIYSLHHSELTVANRGRVLQRYVSLMWQLKPKIVHCWLHYPNLIGQSMRFFCPPHKLITSGRAELSPRAARLEALLSPMNNLRIVNNKNLILANNSKRNPKKRKTLNRMSTS